MPKLRINDREIEVPEGTSVLDAIFHAGYDVPYFCSERHLSPIGACRMCLVKVGAPRKGKDGDWIRDEEGNPQIFWFPKLMAACTTRATEGMVVDTLADEVKKAQAGMVEFHLENHPLDCPTCDKGGACELQDRSYEYGLFEKYYTQTQNGLKTVLYSRFEFTKRHADKHHKLSEFVVLDRERCIHCKRCVRYFEEIPGEEVLDFIERGNHTFIGSEEIPLPAGFSGNITDICPVGALLDLTARFRARNWEFEKTPTVDMNDAFGAAIWVDSRSGRIERIRAREHPETNEIWIADAARFGHGWTVRDRVTAPLIRKDGELVPASLAEAEAYLRERLARVRGEEVGLLLAADGTLEEGYAFAEAARALKADHFGFENATRFPAANLPAARYEELLSAEFALVIGDPAEEMPNLYLRLQAFLKGITPAPRYYHGTPIADLRLEERMPRRKERLAVFAAYPTRLHRFAGIAGVYPPGSAGPLVEALSAILNGKRPEPVPGVPEAELRRVTERFLAAGSRAIVVGAEVLEAPEAAQAVADLARSKGALVFAMPPAAGARGLEAVGLWNPRGPGWEEPGARFLFAFGATPPEEVLAAARLRVLALSHLDPLARAHADLVLPAKTFYEKRGYTVNAEGRVLELRPAPTAPMGSMDGLEALAFWLRAMGKKPPATHYREARERLHERYRLPLELPEEGFFWRPKLRLAARTGEDEGELFLQPTMWKERMLRDDRVRAALGVPSLRVHPATAKKLGLAQGARVEVETRYGRRGATVALDPHLAEGALLFPAFGRGTGRRVPYRLLVPAGGEA